MAGHFWSVRIGHGVEVLQLRCEAQRPVDSEEDLAQERKSPDLGAIITDVKPLFYSCTVGQLEDLESREGVSVKGWRVRRSSVSGRFTLEPPGGVEIAGRRYTVVAPVVEHAIFETQTQLLKDVHYQRVTQSNSQSVALVSASVGTFVWLVLVAVPWAWYFLLARLKEVGNALRGQGPGAA